MKIKYIIINVLLSMAVLFPILFQAVHSYEHFSEHEVVTYIFENATKNKTDLNNQQSKYEKCATCDFHFSSFTADDFFAFSLNADKFVKTATPTLLYKYSSFFKGAIFSLRAPPLF
ncbi:hypothetical protein [Flavobacterium algicola]|uniref:hypothetical protein n=1 Tax=Flavobacterium algicola TaxID=556529 RepID=UPI001EFD7CC5|nr:hypothetical protein [Flavobacterium algicola]MCG9793384.1 hypothetical protein [Flavobacterium algicola]